jgi:hypothetical protein
VKRALIKRGAGVLLLLAGLTLVTVRRELAASAGEKSSASSQTTLAMFRGIRIRFRRLTSIAM